MPKPTTVSLDLIRKPGASVIRATIPANYKERFGAQATFEIVVRIKVKHTSGRDAEHVVFSRVVNLKNSPIYIEIPFSWINHYAYSGDAIQIITLYRLSSNQPNLIDLSGGPIEQEIPFELIDKKYLEPGFEQKVKYKDTMVPSLNWAAVDPSAKIRTTIAISMFTIILLLISCDVYLYSTIKKDVKDSALVISIFGNAVALFIFIGWLVYYGKKILNSYVVFTKKNVGGPILRHQKVRVSDFVAAIPKIDVKGGLFRLVGYNTEHGEYVQGVGEEQSIFPIEKVCNGIVLYEKSLPDIKKGTRLQDYLQDYISFDEMYDRLYPPNLLFATHGLSLTLEAQLIHPDLSDQRAIIPIDMFPFSQFLDEDMRREDDIDPLSGGRVIFESPHGRCVIETGSGLYSVGERSFESERQAMDFLEIAERRKRRS